MKRFFLLLICFVGGFGFSQKQYHFDYTLLYESTSIDSKTKKSNLYFKIISLFIIPVFSSFSLCFKDYKIEGVQFHPESILTPEGAEILKEFLKDIN